MNFDNIVLEKGMYTNPDKSFSEILEELDPSAQYAGTEYKGFGRRLRLYIQVLLGNPVGSSFP